MDTVQNVSDLMKSVSKQPNKQNCQSYKGINEYISSLIAADHALWGAMVEDRSYTWPQESKWLSCVRSQD